MVLVLCFVLFYSVFYFSAYSPLFSFSLVFPLSLHKTQPLSHAPEQGHTTRSTFHFIHCPYFSPLCTTSRTRPAPRG
ncbi:hypothetical protein BDQ17DRAFT_1365930 [Cyathus striatus]|nr:hypothetical protein BDQ17DRAFT_1365930 [Cyathus striatus]